MRLDRRLWRRLTVVRDWPLWSLPRWLTVFVLAVAAVYFAGIGLAAAFTSATGHNLILFGVLITCTLVAIELTRKMGEPGHTAKDVYGIWEFPIAILLPPLFALLAPVPRILFQQWRVRRAPLYRRVFTSASNGLSYCAASLTFHGLSAALMSETRGALAHDLAWTLMVSVSALVYMAVNKALIMTAVSGTGPSLDLRRQFFGGETLYNDSAEICIGFLVTYAVAGNLFLAPAALPVVALLQRSLRHVQLVTDSRADSKTGLLNAATWERESATEVARAVRTESPLAVALLDIDKFKAVNDTHGHLVGDQVLKEIAKTLNSLLRDYDLAGRFGGEEFSVLLPQTRAVDAFRIAERVRESIAALNILVPGMSSAERVQVTVSIGVAALDAGSKRQLSELLAAADAALYRAKACGRDQVQMISTTRGLSAITGTDLGSGGHEDAPSVFRRAQSSLSRHPDPRARAGADGGLGPAAGTHDDIPPSRRLMDCWGPGGRACCTVLGPAAGAHDNSLPVLGCAAAGVPSGGSALRRSRVRSRSLVDAREPRPGICEISGIPDVTISCLNNKSRYHY